MAEETTVTKKEFSPEEINELLNIPGADDAMLPGEEKRPSFFSGADPDLSFLTKKEKETPKTETTETPVVETTPTEVDEIVNNTEEDTNKGRPKVSKDGAIELTRKLIEKGTLIPFDDDKKIEEYTIADIEELLEANLKDKEERLKEEVPGQFFDSLPQELQYAAKYVAEGGKDLKGLFKALSDVQEVHELSADEPKDQEAICVEYLRATNFGDEADIREEVDSWKDRNELDKKAEKFKPKLDKLRQEQVSMRLAEQERINSQRQEASKHYTNSVYETLKPAELNGLKLDKKTQGMLYTGLIQPQYPSLSGKNTNLLGHLLEKYQFVEPNHSLIAEALWLLADPQGYKDKVKEQGKNAATETIARKLKTEEANKITSGSTEDREDNKGPRKIARQQVNIFKR